MYPIVRVVLIVKVLGKYMIISLGSVTSTSWGVSQNYGNLWGSP